MVEQDNPQSGSQVSEICSQGTYGAVAKAVGLQVIDATFKVKEIRPAALELLADAELRDLSQGTLDLLPKTTEDQDRVGQVTPPIWPSCSSSTADTKQIPVYGMPDVVNTAPHFMTEQQPPAFFDVSFPQSEKKSAVNYVFSQERGKLYVKRLEPCPVRFTANFPRPASLSVRVLAKFASPDANGERVIPCKNHTDATRQQHQRGEEGHFVNSLDKHAYYFTDTGPAQHNSVAFPLFPDPQNQNQSLERLVFPCFSTCPSIKRRSLDLIFQLEEVPARSDQPATIIETRKFSLKVCAVPSRDFTVDEKDRPEEISRCYRQLPPELTPVARPMDTSHRSKRRLAQRNDDGQDENLAYMVETFPDDEIADKDNPALHHYDFHATPWVAEAVKGFVTTFMTKSECTNAVAVFKRKFPQTNESHGGAQGLKKVKPELDLM